MKCLGCENRRAIGCEGYCQKCWLEYEGILDGPLSLLKDAFDVIWAKVSAAVKGWWAR